MTAVHSEDAICPSVSPEIQESLLLPEKALQGYYDAIIVKLDQLKKKIDALDRQQRELMTLISDIVIEKEESLPKELSDYNHISDLIDRNQHDLAIDQILVFIQKYPNSERSAYAYYLLAEIYRQNQMYEVALETYETLLNFYPEHPKAPEALYKTAKINQTLRMIDRSIYQYKILLKKYPQSSLCDLAKKELLSLKKEGP